MCNDQFAASARNTNPAARRLLAASSIIRFFVALLLTQAPLLSRPPEQGDGQPLSAHHLASMGGGIHKPGRRVLRV
jgi:hypothetical protein